MTREADERLPHEAADVVIVGGGPAGTATALHLVRVHGVEPSRIVLLERARHPREKPCAGAISRWGIEALARARVAITVPAVTMRGLRVRAGGEAGTFHANDLGCVVRRDAFDASLFETARADGVRASDGEGVLELARRAEGYVVTTTKRAIVAKYVVACDGAGSTVRKRAGLREPARKGHLYVLETPLAPSDESAKEGLCDFDLGVVDEGLLGYYWDFPTPIDGARWVSRGVYHANLFAPAEGARVKAALARALSLRGLEPHAATWKPFSTRPFVAETTLLHEGILFVGEAAGIDATTGEGIAQAILFGEIAATHLARALAGDAKAVLDYPRAVRASRVGRHLLQSAWLAKNVYSARGEPFRRLLARSPAAREAGARWYHGERLGRWTKAALGARLAREAVTALPALARSALTPRGDRDRPRRP